MGRRIASTLEGKRRLEEELKRLRSEERPRIIAAIEVAREKGDLTENAEYDAAKEAQLHLSQRIQELENYLSQIEVVHLDQVQDKARIAFSATVTILELNSDDTHGTRTYRIVGTHEVDVRAGKISIESPIGKSLIGKSVGDVTQVRTPRGVVEYEVIKVEY